MRSAPGSSVLRPNHRFAERVAPLLSMGSPSGRPHRVAGESFGQDLQRDLPVELRISGLIDLPHAPLADEGGHVVVGEARADLQGHALQLTLSVDEHDGANDHPVTSFDIERHADEEHPFPVEKSIDVE